MNYINIVAIILSHIVAGLYMQRQKYSKFVTACSWSIYALFAICIILLGKNIVFGFFCFFILHFVIFHVTTVGSIGENTFLFLTYASSFCIYIGANCILSAFFSNSIYMQVSTLAILILIHIFLYKFLIPTYKKSKIFFPSGWWKLNIVLIFFLIQFLNQYAFSIVDKNTAGSLIFDFVIFSIIFYSTLGLIFNLVKDVAEKNKKALENDELKNVAYIDTLTSMKNRSAYAKFTRRQVIKHRNNISTKSLFVIMDIDEFKNINDTKGHAAGDEVLKQVGAFITKYFEAFDCESFRIGGDEFVLLLDEMPLDDIEEQIRKMNEDLFTSIGVTLSYGCSKVDFNNLKPFDIALEAADGIMYSNKHQKKIYS